MPRTTRPSTDRTNDFIDAARELFGEKGFENTSVDDIVSRVGVAKGLFYYYFDSKEELIAILYDRLVEEIRSSITAAMEKKGLTAMQRFGELLESSRDIACRSSMLVAYFIKERNQAYRFTMEKSGHGMMIDAMQGIIHQGIEEGIFHALYPRETAIAIVSMFRGLRGDLPEEITGDQLVRMTRAVQDLTERLLRMDEGTFTAYDKMLPPTIERDGAMKVDTKG